VIFARWIFDHLGPDVPLHFSRFHPMYKLRNLPPTPVKTLRAAREIALEIGLRYVYVGNVPDADRESTYCPTCGELLIRRHWYTVHEHWAERGVCPNCGQTIAGTWS